MAKPKQLSEINSLKHNGASLKTFLHNNPNKLREFFVNVGFDFDDMGFDIDSEYVCCPFCKDNGYHGHVNYNDELGTHNIYCYKCSETKNNGRAYTPWDYLTQIYRIEEGDLYFLDAVINLYGSFDDLKKAYEGEEVELKERELQPHEDKQQIFIDEIYNKCNGDVLAFVEELYNKSWLYEVEPYIKLYENIKYDVAYFYEESEKDQNTEIFSKSSIPIKKANSVSFDTHIPFGNDEKNIGILFSLGTTFVYVIPTVTPSSKIVQLAFRIGDGETGANKPKVKKVKGRYKNVNISFLFGFHNFVGFQKGMPIALVEGEKDAIALQTIYPYTLAMGRNTLGNNIKYLKYLTNDFIIIPDNDEAGLRGYEKIKRDMDKYGLKLHPIFIPKNSGFKDVADMYFAGETKNLVHKLNNVKKKYSIT